MRRNATQFALLRSRQPHTADSLHPSLLHPSSCIKTFSPQYSSDFPKWLNHFSNTISRLALAIVGHHVYVSLSSRPFPSRIGLEIVLIWPSVSVGDIFTLIFGLSAILLSLVTILITWKRRLPEGGKRKHNTLK